MRFTGEPPKFVVAALRVVTPPLSSYTSRTTARATSSQQLQILVGDNSKDDEEGDNDVGEGGGKLSNNEDSHCYV